MSSKGGFSEVAGVELADFIARHPNCAVVWMSKSAASRYIGYFRVSGDYNIIIYFDGQP
ncbi:MAG: hypothetical protein WC451_00425 [Patescibacteria group bacterium]